MGQGAVVNLEEGLVRLATGPGLHVELVEGDGQPGRLRVQDERARERLSRGRGEGDGVGARKPSEERLARAPGRVWRRRRHARKHREDEGGPPHLARRVEKGVQCTWGQALYVQ